MYKIYKITSPQTDLCYVGMTSAKYLCTRFAQHKYSHRRGIMYCRSFDILDMGDCKIQLVEDGIQDKRVALQRERYHIMSCNCSNKIHNGGLGK